MAVSAVVTRGFGSGIASIALVVTAGYTAADAGNLPDSMTASTRQYLSVRATEAYLDGRTTRSTLNARTTEDA